VTDISPALVGLFNSIVAGTAQNWCSFDLYTITLAGGSVLKFTTADFDINCGSGTSYVGLPQPSGRYLSGGVRVDQDPKKGSKTQAHWKTGLDTDTWVVVLMPRPVDPVTGAAFPDQIGNVPFTQAASGGALDAADFQVDRAYFSTVPTWPMPPGGAVPLGTKTIFAGVVAEVDTTDLVVALTVNDYRSLFTIQMPLHFYQAQCRHTLYDTGCNASGNMNQASFAVAGVVGGGSTQGQILAPGLATPAGSGTYALGTVIMTSGLNNGFSRTVSQWAAGVLSLVNPFPFALIAGDTFNAYPGCDWQFSTCGAFANSANFGGQPFIPPPETMA
jgi:Phage conserved hypothetical protein BR0599/Uncharacterized conserved protein (DUF2163)